MKKIIPFFRTSQLIEQMNESLYAADISIDTLTDDTASVSVPSKTYNLLAVGSPLLCIAPIESELSELVKNMNAGNALKVKRWTLWWLLYEI